MADIHPTAIVQPGAVIGSGTTVGAYSIIGPKVVLGENNRIGPHAVLEGNTRIGSGNQIFQFSSVGAIPQDLKYRGEDSVLEIGDRNIIREFVTLQPGTQGGGMLTKIGSGNLFMANSHVGHDCTIGEGNVVANSVAVAGHVTIGNRTIIGGLSGIHQFVRLGDLCLIGAGAMVSLDVPPYCAAQGDRAKLVGLNSIGLERNGYSAEEIRKLKSFYRSLFLGAGTLKERLASIGGESKGSQLIETLSSFIRSSERGVTGPRKGSETSDSESD